MTSTTVTNDFTYILARSPIGTEGQAYDSLLTNGVFNANTLAQALANSTEAQNYVDPVVLLYETSFGRAPDSAGLQFWTGLFESTTLGAGKVTANGLAAAVTAANGATTAQVAAYNNALVSVANSFVSVLINTNFGGVTPSNTQFVQYLYQNLLGHSADASGLAYWVNALSTQSMGSVLANFVAVANTQSANTTAIQNWQIASAAAGAAQPVINIQPVGQTVALTTGVDTITLSGNNNVVNAVLSNGIVAPATNPSTLTGLDSITGTGTGNILNIVDAAGLAALTVPTGITVSGVQTVNVETVNGLGTGTGTLAFNVSGFSGLQNFNVTTSTGADYISAATTTSVSVVDTNGPVNVAGGNAVTVTTKGAITVSGAVGAVAVTDKATAVDTISVQGGTTVSVTATAASNDVVNVGAAPVLNAANTALTTASAATEPTGAVTVNESTTTKGITAFGTGKATIYTNGATSVSLTGTAADAISDVQTAVTNGTSTLAKVTLDGVTGATTIASNALTSLTIQDDDNVVVGGSAATVTVTNTAAHALALTVGANKVTGDSSTAALTPVTEYANVTDATATGVTVSTTGTVAADVTLNVATATSLTFNNTAKVTLDALSALNDVTAITATGAGVVNLGNLSASAVKTIDSSAATGGVTVEIGTSQVFKGGAGTNVVTLDGALTTTSTGSITFGAGHNSLLAGAAASIASGVTVDGGSSGANTISASLVNAGNAAGIKDFQILDVSGFGSGAGNGALDTSLMVGSTVSGVSITTAATNGTATLLNLGNAITVTDSADGSSSSLVLTHSAGAGTLAVNFADAAITPTTETISSITSTGDTSIAVSSAGVKGVANAITSLTETDNHLTTVTITGSDAFTLGAVHTNSAATASSATTTASSLTTIDGSAATGALNITAGASDVNGNVTTTYAGLTIKGGVGGDIIVNHAANGVIIEGATVSTTAAPLFNTLTVDGKGASINDAASGGADVISLNGLNESATLGSGTGVQVTVAADAAAKLSDVASVTFGSGTAAVTDNLLYTVTGSSTTSAATTGDVLVLNGTLHGQTIGFGATNLANAGALGTAASIGAAQTFDQAVFIADHQAGVAANTATWFQYAGNTYIEVTGANATVDASDAHLIKIAGVVDLSHATVAATGITFA